MFSCLFSTLHMSDPDISRWVINAPTSYKGIIQHSAPGGFKRLQLWDANKRTNGSACGDKQYINLFFSLLSLAGFRDLCCVTPLKRERSLYWKKDCGIWISAIAGVCVFCVRIYVLVFSVQLGLTHAPLDVSVSHICCYMYFFFICTPETKSFWKSHWKHWPKPNRRRSEVSHQGRLLLKPNVSPSLYVLAATLHITKRGHEENRASWGWETQSVDTVRLFGPELTAPNVAKRLQIQKNPLPL